MARVEGDLACLEETPPKAGWWELVVESSHSLPQHSFSSDAPLRRESMMRPDYDSSRYDDAGASSPTCTSTSSCRTPSSDTEMESDYTMDFRRGMPTPRSWSQGRAGKDAGDKRRGGQDVYDRIFDEEIEDAMGIRCEDQRGDGGDLWDDFWG